MMSCLPLPLQRSLHHSTAMPPLAQCGGGGRAVLRPQQRSCRIPCKAQRETDWDTERQRVPNAPPIRMPPSPPPPPPPPPPPGSRSVLGPFGRRGALLAIMFGGAAISNVIVNSTLEPTVISRRTSAGKLLNLTRTRGGNLLATFVDEHDNIFFVDRNANLWYDTGDPRLGFYFVDMQGNVLNVFVDGAGEPQYVPIGKLNDMVAAEVDQIGGVAVSDLEKAHGNAPAQVKQLFAFPSPDGPLPDNAPAVVGKDGTVQPPPVLEEGALLLQEKRQWWPFDSNSEPGGGKFRRENNTRF